MPRASKLLLNSMFLAMLLESSLLTLVPREISQITLAELVIKFSTSWDIFILNQMYSTMLIKNNISTP
jgi:hypothetical protein